MRRSRVLSAILLTLTFLLGMGVGMLVDLSALSDTGDQTHDDARRPHDERRGKHRGRKDGRARFREKLIADLKLTSKQVEQLDEILAKQAERYKQLRKEMEPMFAKFEEVLQSTREQIRGILNQEQLERFNKKTEEFDRRRKKYWERRRARRKEAERSSTRRVPQGGPTHEKAIKPNQDKK